MLNAISAKWAYAVLFFGIFLGGYPSGAVSAPWYRFIQIPGFDASEQIFFFIPVGATLVIVSILMSPQLRKFFSMPALSRLGKYTYSLYLIHMPVLFTVCTGAFLSLSFLGFHKAAILASLIAFATLVPLTLIFEKYVDRPSVWFAGYCTDLFVGKRKLNLKEKYNTLRLYMVAKMILLRRREAPEIMPEIEMD